VVVSGRRDKEGKEWLPSSKRSEQRPFCFVLTSARIDLRKPCGQRSAFRRLILAVNNAGRKDCAVRDRTDRGELRGYV